MRGAIITAVAFALSACASTETQELPFDPSSPMAMFVYTPNYGDVFLRRIDLANRRAERQEHRLPSIDSNKVRLLRLSVDPLLADPNLNAIQTELHWNLQSGTDIFFAQSLVPPGDYAILRHKERASSFNIRMYGTMCFSAGAPILRVAAGQVYFMDGINTIVERAERDLGGADVDKKSARLVNALLNQKPGIQGSVSPLKIVDVAAFEPAAGLLNEDCAIGPDFTLVFD